MAKVHGGIILPSMNPTGEPLYPGKNGEKVLYPGGDPRLSGRTVCSVEERRLAGIAHPEILFPGHDGKMPIDTFSLLADQFPALKASILHYIFPRPATLSGDREARSLSPGLLSGAASKGLSSGPSAVKLPCPTPEISWHEFEGIHGEGPEGSYVVNVSGITLLTQFPITLNNGKYVAVDGENYLYAVYLNYPLNREILIRGYLPFDDSSPIDVYETVSWADLSGPPSEGTYGAPVASAFTREGSSELVIAAPVEEPPASGSESKICVYRHSDPHALASTSGAVSALWEAVGLKVADKIRSDATGTNSAVDQVSLVHDEAGNLHLAFRARAVDDLNVYGCGSLDAQGHAALLRGSNS